MFNRIKSLIYRSAENGNGHAVATAFAEYAYGPSVEQRSEEVYFLSQGGDQLSAILGAGAPTVSGVPITEQSALGLTAVMCAVRVLGEAIASLPLVLYRRRKSGGKERATEHPSFALAHDAPNDMVTAYEFKLAMVTHWALWGNSLSLVERAGSGQALHLWTIAPWLCNIFRPDPWRIIYPTINYYVNGQLEDPDDILHIRGPFTLDGYLGLSPVRMARQALGLCAAEELYAANWFDKNAVPDGFIKMIGRMSEPEQDLLIKSLEHKHGGPVKRSRLGILPPNCEFQQNTMPAKDFQFVMQRTFQLDEVARIFNVPVHKLKAMGRATWSNIGDENLSFVIDTLRPITVSICQSMNKSLLMPSERQEYFFEFDFAHLLSADPKTRTTTFSAQFDRGIRGRDEWREAEGLNPVGGQQFVLPLNTSSPGDEGKDEEEGAIELETDTAAIGNPYKVVKKGKKWAVVKISDGKTVPGGLHATKAEAMKHFAALEINVVKKEDDRDEEEKQEREKEEDADQDDPAETDPDDVEDE